MKKYEPKRLQGEEFRTYAGKKKLDLNTSNVKLAYGSQRPCGKPTINFYDPKMSSVKSLKSSYSLEKINPIIRKLNSRRSHRNSFEKFS